MSVTATAKGVRISPRKVGVVSSLVRGRNVKDALVILDNTPRRSAQSIKKLIISARANAEHNHGYKPDTLLIESITVTPGVRIKRFRPVARGMAHPFIRRTSHISIVVNGEKREIKKATSKVNDKTTVKETK